MRLLVLGGSWFVGMAVVSQAITRGHAVTVFNRGRSTAAMPPEVQHVTGDWEHRADLRRLVTVGPWDAVIDIAGTIPRLVLRCAGMLGLTPGCWTRVVDYAADGSVAVWRVS
ncbi:NAD-dependent epimerase/dehydratase family protein [Kribbella qitaiheensis]|uniref:NAD-dependent epimerase/dehydratase family protein n=1 Tax=Kribbella qitaiheensis TaxID=1544730 RepID=A0A7G6WXJ6_9ACTN|nr:NAD-dependent epimerase/dehydratase family protein [Kribbella qitaiheensis]QNE18711.1 NAD-dependent epimerase/dehydratase family protein [Kribbella qitaiheensis]